MRLDYLCTSVTACCVLHNMCELHRDAFDEQWLADVDETSVPSRTGSTLPSTRATSICSAFADI